MSRSTLFFGLNVSFDQVLAQNIGYALVRRQCSIGPSRIQAYTRQHGG